jgi:LysR family hydrogen peroxide-inducible transcriptional activator
MSVGISDLEKLLGVVLVERTKRSVRFTQTGEDLVEQARRVMRGVEDLCESARAASKPLAGTIRLAVIPTVAPFVLPRMLPATKASWPDLRLLVREKLTTDACAALQHGSVDCVLLALPVDCGDVESFAIGVDRLLLGVCGAEASPTTPVALDDIDSSRLLLLEDGHCLKDHALAACDRTTPQSEALLVASTLHTLVQMVDAGLGITLLPEMAVRAGLLAGTRVTSHELISRSAQRHIALAWRRGSARARDYRLLGETIRSAVSLL